MPKSQIRRIRFLPQILIVISMIIAVWWQINVAHAQFRLAPGTIIIAEQGANQVLLLPPGGPPTPLAAANQPRGVAFGPDGNIYVVEGTASGQLLQITPAGTVTPILSNLPFPEGITVDYDGRLVVTLFGTGDVIRVNPDGSGLTPFGAGLNQPSGIAAASLFSQLGGYFVTQWGAGTLDFIPADGSLPIPVFGPMLNPDLMAAAPDGLIYVADFAAGNPGLIVEVDPLTGTPRIVTNAFTDPVAVAVDTTVPDFDLIVAADGEIWRVDRWTGATASLGLFNNPAGVAVVPAAPSFLDSFNPEPKHNPDIGCLGCDCVCPEDDDRGTVDPVYLHSGEFFLETVDLVIPGRGFDFAFVRTYASQSLYNGPLGFNWKHNYDWWLQPVGDDIHSFDPTGRLDVYTSTNNIDFSAPSGHFTDLVVNADTTITIFAPDGQSATFLPFTDPVAAGKLVQLSDPLGNVMVFNYDKSGLLNEVVDTLGRSIDYVYVDGRLDHIEDFNGRRVSYDYDANGDLITVTSPTVTGTPNGNDFPGGKTTAYTYSSGFAEPALNHNMLTVTAPNEAATIVGAARVANVYGTTPGAYDFDRLIQQTWGGTNNNFVPAGGTVLIDYQSLNPGADPTDLIVPRNRTTLTDRNGNIKVYEHNVNGNRIFLQEQTNRNVRPSDPAAFEWSWAYDGETRLVQSVAPLGNTVTYLYDETNPDRRQQGNLLAETHTPDGSRSGDQSLIQTTYTYDPIYNQVRTTTDPRGNDGAYVPQNGGAQSPERYTTQNTFDYEEGCDFAELGTRTGRSAVDVEQLLAAAGMCLTPLGDVNGDGLTTQVSGLVIRIDYATVLLLAGFNMVAIEGGTSQSIAELLRYNEFGQLVLQRDPEANVTEYEYYSEQDPDGDGDINNPAGDPISGGYLAQTRFDTTADPIRNSNTNPPPVNIIQQFEYDPVGNIVREVDGRGIATDYIVNELNQVVQLTRAAATGVFATDPSEPVALTDFQFIERFYYDANDNLVLHQREDRGDRSNVDGNPPLADLPPGVVNPDPLGGPAFIDTVYKYDLLDNLIETAQEVENGGAPDLVYTRYRYDSNENRVVIVAPEGNATSAFYDERDLLFEEAVGATSPPPVVHLGPADPPSYDVRGGTVSTGTFHYDANRNLTETVDADDTDSAAANNSDLGGAGDRTRYVYDGFDRLTSIVDSLGNQTVHQYDPAGNHVRVTAFGPTGGASPTSDGPDTLPGPVSVAGVIQTGNLVTNNVLAGSEYLYDELNRPFQTDEILLVNTITTQRLPDVADGAIDLGKGDLTPEDDHAIPGLTTIPVIGRVSQWTEFDRHSRVVFVVEDDEDTQRVFYDGHDREIDTLDAEGNIVRYAYDDNDNLIEMEARDIAQVSGVADELFVTTFFFDSLDRQQRAVDNLGQTIEYRYDSRNNVVATTDAAGPLTSATITRRAFSGGAGTINAINDFGNVTTYTYDGLDRQVRTDLVLTASGSGDGVNIGVDIFGVPGTLPTPDLGQGGGDGLITNHVAYDGNSLAAARTDDQGNQTTYTYDNLNRRLVETKGICVPPNLADSCDPPTSTTYAYDPDHNVSQVIDENGSAFTFTYDGASRLVTETIAPGAGVVGTTVRVFEYDGLSRQTLTTDNNESGASDDTIVTHAYDSLSRVIEETGQIAGQTGIVSSSWRAEDLRRGLVYPNERSTTFSYDGLDRIQIIHGEPITETFSVYLPVIMRPDNSQNAGDTDPPVRLPLARGGSDVLVTYDYIGTYRVLARTYANGVRATYLDDTGTAAVGYDGLRRPVQLRHLTETDDLVVGFTYAYDRANNQVAENKFHDVVNDQAYLYDSAHRLVDFDRPDVAAVAPLHQSWALDGAGNWRQVDGETRQHSSFNEIIDIDGTPLLSDDNGNLVDDGTYTYAYDALNRLRRVTRQTDGLEIARYAYDGLDRRSSKVVTNTGALDGTTRYFYDAWQVLEERNDSDEIAQQYVYGGVYLDELVILDRDLDGDNSAIGANDQRLWYHQNSLFSPFALTDDGGTIVEGYQYEGYGLPVVYQPGVNGAVDFGGDDVITPGGDSALGNPYLFTGRRWDSETTLYAYRARTYSANLGRFLQRDPIGIWRDSMNWGNPYAYVGNNPLNYVDPMGRQGTPAFPPLGYYVTLGRGANAAINAATGISVRRAIQMVQAEARNGQNSGALQMPDGTFYNFTVWQRGNKCYLQTGRWGIVCVRRNWYGTCAQQAWRIVEVKTREVPCCNYFKGQG